jgi:N-terminal domain of reverse transcriptase
VHRLQRRIVQAQQHGQKRKVRALQFILTWSTARDVSPYDASPKTQAVALPVWTENCSIHRTRKHRPSVTSPQKIDFATAKAVIDERHHAYLGICIRHDTHGTAGLDVAIPSTELHAVGVKLDFRFISAPAQRLTSNRPHAAVAEVTDVTELTPAVARGIFAPTGYI